MSINCFYFTRILLYDDNGLIIIIDINNLVDNDNSILNLTMQYISTMNKMKSNDANEMKHFRYIKLLRLYVVIVQLRIINEFRNII